MHFRHFRRESVLTTKHECSGSEAYNPALRQLPVDIGTADYPVQDNLIDACLSITHLEPLSQGHTSSISALLHG